MPPVTTLTLTVSTTDHELIGDIVDIVSGKVSAELKELTTETEALAAKAQAIKAEMAPPK